MSHKLNEGVPPKGIVS